MGILDSFGKRRREITSGERKNVRPRRDSINLIESGASCGRSEEIIDAFSDEHGVYGGGSGRGRWRRGQCAPGGRDKGGIDVGGGKRKRRADGTLEGKLGEYDGAVGGDGTIDEKQGECKSGGGRWKRVQHTTVGMESEDIGVGGGRRRDRDGAVGGKQGSGGGRWRRDQYTTREMVRGDTEVGRGRKIGDETIDEKQGECKSGGGRCKRDQHTTVGMDSEDIDVGGGRRRDRDGAVAGKQGEYDRSVGSLRRDQYTSGGGDRGNIGVGGRRERRDRDASAGGKQGEYGSGGVRLRGDQRSLGGRFRGDTAGGEGRGRRIGDSAVERKHGEYGGGGGKWRKDQYTTGGRGQGTEVGGGRPDGHTAVDGKQEYDDCGSERTGEYIGRERMTKRQDIDSGRKLRGDARDRQSSQRRDGVVRGQNFMLDNNGDISNVQCGNSNTIVHVKNITVMSTRVQTRRPKPRPRSKKVRMLTKVRQHTWKYGVGTKVTRPTKSVRPQFKDIDIKEYLKIGLLVSFEVILMIVNMFMKD